MVFPDFQHFMGNKTPFVTTDPVQSFRLLDYYLYSTKDWHWIAHSHTQFRRLLATQFIELRFLGLKENLFANYLLTDQSKNYLELGYSLDHIFRFLRVEVIAAFEDMQYKNWGIRIGVATSVTGAFSF